MAKQGRLVGAVKAVAGFERSKPLEERPQSSRTKGKA
jgi:hypothetical protein